ncbi:MAG TPA: hypothetical protein PKD73_17735, partial [Burkholderiaceae bacterium]|nr:hypothetical protein [Burkholderiaceae bacterium]
RSPGRHEPSLSALKSKGPLMRRGLMSSAAQRKPAAPMSATARAEIEHLLGRLARHDPRAALPAL